MIRRHMYHHEGVTDVSVMRREAAHIALREPVLLHLHPYDELRRCNAGDDHHETFGVNTDERPAPRADDTRHK